MGSERRDRPAGDHRLLVIGRSRIQAEAEAVAGVSQTLDEAFLAALRLIEARRGKVLVTGAGTSASIARRMAHLLSVTGTSALYLDSGESIHGSLGAVEPGDVLIAISKNGASGEVNTTAERALGRGASLLVVTSNPSSPLASMATLTILLPTSENSDPGGIVAMGSTLAAAAWGDALAMALMELHAYSWRDVLYTHPGGAVGKRQGPDEPVAQS
jgi:D-arabinose 5-phosphate isomerase GutQ